MAHLMSDGASAIKVPAGSDLEKAISGAASVAEIHSLLWEAAKSQRLIEKDPFDVDGTNHFTYKVIENPQPTGFAKSVIMNGVKIILEAASERELLAKETDLYRQALAGSTNTPAGTEQARDTNGRFIAQPSQAELEAEAERLANIDPAASALAPSVTAALEAVGIDVNALRDYTATKQAAAAQQSWVSATETFRNSSAGSSWPGGVANRQKLSECLVELGFADSPSAENLSKAYAYMKKNNLLVENEETALTNKVNAANTPEELRAIIGYKGPQTARQIWG